LAEAIIHRRGNRPDWTGWKLPGGGQTSRDAGLKGQGSQI
jgi:hypothetical protein